MKGFKHSREENIKAQIPFPLINNVIFKRHLWEQEVVPSTGLHLDLTSFPLLVTKVIIDNKQYFWI